MKKLQIIKKTGGIIGFFKKEEYVTIAMYEIEGNKVYIFPTVYPFNVLDEDVYDDTEQMLETIERVFIGKKVWIRNDKFPTDNIGRARSFSGWKLTNPKGNTEQMLYKNLSIKPIKRVNKRKHNSSGQRQWR